MWSIFGIILEAVIGFGLIIIGCVTSNFAWYVAATLFGLMNIFIDLWRSRK